MNYNCYMLNIGSKLGAAIWMTIAITCIWWLLGHHTHLFALNRHEVMPSWWLYKTMGTCQHLTIPIDYFQLQIFHQLSFARTWCPNVQYTPRAMSFILPWHNLIPLILHCLLMCIGWNLNILFFVLFRIYTYHCEDEVCHWLQGEAALQAQSSRDADTQPVIPQKESGWNVLKTARNYKTWLEISGYGWRYIILAGNCIEWLEMAKKGQKGL